MICVLHLCQSVYYVYVFLMFVFLSVVVWCFHNNNDHHFCSRGTFHFTHTHKHTLRPIGQESLAMSTPLTYTDTLAMENTNDA